MQTLVETSIAQSASGAERTDGVRYVARQPILDLRGRVHAYELLFRAGPEAAFRGDGDRATGTMLDNAVLFGLENLTGGLAAFINCTPRALIENLVDVLPSGMTVLEILETIEPTEEVVRACRKLKLNGYRLALDDFVWKPKFMPLVEMADYIKVDFQLTARRERVELFKRLRGRPVAMLAEKVETQEEYRRAQEEGFTLFQGYYFCRPLLMENRTFPSNRLMHFEILQLLQAEELDLDKARRLMERSPSITYRLLRLVNSPVYAACRDIGSVQEAILAVGEKTFRRVVTLAVASELNGHQPAEILHMAFVRARFCELASEGCGLSMHEQYLLGMLSMLPAMMRLPMEDLAPALPLRDEIQAALQGTDNCERMLLGWIEAYERGEWAACDAVVEARGLDQQEMFGHYRSALVWATTALELSA